jgi:hypothetical protein
LGEREGRAFLFNFGSQMLQDWKRQSKSMEMVDIWAILAPKPKKTSTSSTPTMGSIHNIKAGISAPTIREVIIVTLLLV